MTVFTRLVQQDDLVDMQYRILAQVVADRLRRAKQTARDSPRVTFRILRLPFLVFGTKFECPGRRSVAVFAEPTRGIVFQRELEERDTFGASSRFLIRLRTHEIADQGHILIGRQLNDHLARGGYPSSVGWPRQGKLRAAGNANTPLRISVPTTRRNQRQSGPQARLNRARS